MKIFLLLTLVAIRVSLVVIVWLSVVGQAYFFTVDEALPEMKEKHLLEVVNNCITTCILTYQIVYYQLLIKLYLMKIRLIENPCYNPIKLELMVLQLMTQQVGTLLLSKNRDVNIQSWMGKYYPLIFMGENVILGLSDPHLMN